MYHNLRAVCTHNEAAVAELEVVQAGPNYQKGDRRVDAYSYWYQMRLINASAGSDTKDVEQPSRNDKGYKNTNKNILKVEGNLEHEGKNKINPPNTLPIPKPESFFRTACIFSSKIS